MVHGLGGWMLDTGFIQGISTILGVLAYGEGVEDILC